MGAALAGELSSEEQGGEPQGQARPFVKWAGGKSQLLDELLSRAPRSFNRYFEPFVGGGALFFRLQPTESVLVDVNAELIATYTVIRDSIEELIEHLKLHRYEKEYYYGLRSADRSPEFKGWPPVQRASRFIYLNKSCFNGLYRVNAKGQFNTPFGRYKNPTICDEKNLRRCSKALQSAELRVGQFSSVENQVGEGDFVYLDPPYVPVSDTANFTGYTAAGFGPAEQQKLAEFCRRISESGAMFMLSNAFAPGVEELYRGFKVEQVLASRAINSNGQKRGKVTEIIVTNYR
jgi:DNA adenine methylase